MTTLVLEQTLIDRRAKKHSADCARCNKGIVGGVQCVPAFAIAFADGTTRQAIPYDEDGRCYDCGVRRGSVHHDCCDREPCPRCDGQLLSCGCTTTGARVREMLGWSRA